MNLFDVISDKFMLPLYCMNKRFYADCLMKIHSFFQSGARVEISKDELFALIDETLSAYKSQELAPEADSEDVAEDSQEVLVRPLDKRMVFYRIRNCGWINVEDDESGRPVIITLTRQASEFLSAMRNLTTRRQSLLGGYILQINDALENIVDGTIRKHPYTEGLAFAYNGVTNLLQDTRTLRLEITEEIQKIQGSEDYKEAIDNLNTFLSDASKGKLHALQQEEAINSGHIDAIQQKINQIADDDELFYALVKDVQTTNTELTEEEAENMVNHTLSAIQSHTRRGLDDAISRIQDIQSKYLSSARTRLGILSSKNTAVNELSRIIERLSDVPDDDFDDLFGAKFSLPIFRYLSEETSLYKAKQRDYNTAFMPDALSPEPASEDDLDFSEVRRSQRYSVARSNRYIHKLLQGKSTLGTEDFPLDTPKEWRDLVGVIVNSQSEEREYDVIIKDGKNIDLHGASIPEITVIPRAAATEGGTHD